MNIQSRSHSSTYYSIILSHFIMKWNKQVTQLYSEGVFGCINTCMCVWKVYTHQMIVKPIEGRTKIPNLLALV